MNLVCIIKIIILLKYLKGCLNVYIFIFIIDKNFFQENIYIKIREIYMFALIIILTNSLFFFIVVSIKHHYSTVSLDFSIAHKTIFYDLKRIHYCY